MHDEAWFERLYRDHVDAIYRYFVRRAPRDDVQDLCAEVFLVAWRRRSDLPGEDLELPWLYRTAKYLLANHRRKIVALPVAEVPEQLDDDGPEAAAIADERARAAFAQLSERDREILLLAAWEGLGGAELAQVLGVTRGGADAALSRARARLDQAWAKAEAAPVQGGRGSAHEGSDGK